MERLEWCKGLFRGVPVKVQRKIFTDDDGLEYTTTESDQEWFDEMKNIWAKSIPNDTIYDYIKSNNSLSIIKMENKFYAFESPKGFTNDIYYDDYYFRNFLDHNRHGEGFTPEDSIKDLIYISKRK